MLQITSLIQAKQKQSKYLVISNSQFKQMIIENIPSLDPQDQVDDLKGQLNATNLRLKDNEFNANRNKENFELKISKLQDEKKILKDKFEK